MRLLLALAGLLLAFVAPAEARMHAPYRGHRIVPAATAPLDGFTQPAAAYSFRLLRSAYAGPAMRLVRDSDSAELDIGFTSSGDWNAAAAAAHCVVAPNCYVMTAYDQSGNGRHATQAVPGNRPWYSASCLGVGRPCMLSNWSAIGLQSASYAGVTSSSFSTVSRRTTANTGLCSFIAKGLNRIASHNTNPPASFWLVAFVGGEIVAPAADNAWHVANGVLNGVSSVLRIDGVETPGTVGVDTAAGVVTLNGGAASTNCETAEAFVWENYSLTPAERIALENNQHNYWTPYTLDNLAQPAGAYSMRRLRSAYTGPAIRIARASDWVELDVNFLGYVPGLGAPIDVAAINAHCAATTCYIHAWYDQSGNARDAWHDSTPLLLGQNCVGSLPCAQSQTTGQRNLFGPVGSLVAKTSVSVVGKRVSGTQGCGFFQKGLNIIASQDAVANTWIATDYTIGSYNMPATDNVWHAGMAITPTGGPATGRIDATETVGPALSGSPGGHIILNPGYTGAVCQATEMVAWDNYALTAGERTFIQTNQKNFWGTP